MNIYICCIGKLKLDSPENKIVQEYLKKINWSVSIIEKNVKKELDTNVLKLEETNILLKSCPPSAYKIVLDERGKSMSSLQFSSLIQNVQEQARDMAFFIGGTFGHSDKMRACADTVLSLSALTFPHFLVRPFLIEQIYRAQTILSGHPYHKI